MEFNILFYHSKLTIAFQKIFQVCSIFFFFFHLIISVRLNILTSGKSNSTTGIQNLVLTFYDQWMHHNCVKFTSSYIYTSFIPFGLWYVFYSFSFIMKVLIDSLTTFFNSFISNKRGLSHNKIIKWLYYFKIWLFNNNLITICINFL